jgi:hypothetical protein
VMAVVMVIGFIMRRRAAAQQPALAGAGGMQYAGAGADVNRDRHVEPGFSAPLPAPREIFRPVSTSKLSSAMPR